MAVLEGTTAGQDGPLHGADNSALLDALRHSNGKAKGVVTVRRSVSDQEPFVKWYGLPSVTMPAAASPSDGAVA